MRLLAIDPGLAQTGWALANNGRLATSDGMPVVGTITTSPKFGTAEERVRTIAAALLELFRRLEPDQVAVESYVYQGPRSETPAGFTVSRIVGIVEGLAAAWEAPSITLDRNTINRSMALTGDVPKARVRQMVESVWKLRPGQLRNEHEVDACELLFVASSRFREVRS